MSEPQVNIIPTDENSLVETSKEKTRMSEERRAHIFRVLKRSIKQIAREKRQLMHKSAEFAKLCVLDAFQGRLSNGLANNSKKAKWIYQIFCIQTSDWMFKAVVIASTLHTFSIFFEPPHTCPNSILFKLFQSIVMLIFAVDIGLKMGYEGVHEYFRHDWQQLYVANLIFGVLDLLISGCTFYSNPLRPLAGLLRARRGRKFFETLKKMIPGMLQNLVPVLFFVVIVMILCSILFDTHVTEFRSTAYTFYNWLFLVLTNDTFDRLLPDTLFLNLTYLMFFFPAIYVGQRFLFNLIIGDTYQTFRSYVKKQLKKEKLKELQGLTKAFAVLDVEKRGKISDVQWNALMSKLYPELSEEALALYFELISGGNATITILQFLSLRNVLSFNLSYSKDSTNIIVAAIRNFFHQLMDYYHHFQLKVSDKIVHFATKAFEKSEEYMVWKRLNQLDLVILSLEISEYPVLGGWLFGLTLCQLLLIFHVIEFLLRLFSENGKIAAVSQNLNTISTCYVVGCIGCIVYYLLTGLSSHYFSYEFVRTSTLFVIPIGGFAITYHKVLMFLRLLRSLRIANNSEELRDFNAALLDIIPSLSETFIFTFILTYMFGTLGNILFGAYLVAWKTPLLSIVKAQQLTFMVSFLSSMEEAMHAVNPIVALTYFVTFLISSLTVSNVALSIIIDLHSNVLDMKSKKERDSNKKKLDLLFAKIIDQARLRRIFRSDLPPLNFKHIKMSSFQSSDVRHFIAQGGEGDNNQYGFSLEELASCQKYANIDLLKFYNESHRNHKDVNWEMNFMKSLYDLGLHQEIVYQKGDTLFNADDKADHLFLLTKGAVLLVKKTTEECVAFSTKFIGAESLHPNGRYEFSCYAEEDDTKCSVFKQDDIAHKISPDVLGCIIQMVFISHREIMNSFGTKKLLRRQTTRQSLTVVSKEDI